MARDLERERERFLRSGRPCCIALGDLDHFKGINDSYGHGAGDKVLAGSADCFLRHMRPYDSLFRYGGEEFLFCLPDTDLAVARKVFDRLRQELESRSFELDTGERISVTASFGIAEMTDQATVEKTTERADQALYRAKSAGRNRVGLWTPETAPADEEEGGNA